MSLSARALLACLVSWLFAAATAAAATVSGTVTSATMKRLPSMVVRAYDAQGNASGDTETKADGSYSLTLPAGNYRLLAFDPDGVYATAFDGGADSFATTPLRTVGNDLIVNFTLFKAGLLSGDVESATGASRRDIVVAAYNLSGTQRAYTRTNDRGEYQLALPPGTFKLVAWDDNGVYATTFYRNARTFSEATPLTIAEAASVTANFRLEVAARIEGTTTDATNGLPLPAITVYAYTADGIFVGFGTSNAVGLFSLALPPGTYRLVAADPAHVFALAFSGATRAFETAAVIDLAPGEVQSGVALALPRAAKIAGRVVSAEGGALPDVRVVAYNTDGTAHAFVTTAADGTYELTVAPGTYKIAAVDDALVFAPQFHRAKYDFEVATELFVAASDAARGFDFVLQRAGRITGTVVSAPTSQPVTGITVAAYDATDVHAGSTATGADGRYTLLVAPGSYHVLAYDGQLRYATGYAGGATSYDTTVPIAVGSDAVVTVDLALHRAVEVRGTVKSESGVPLDNVEVFALDASGNRVAGTFVTSGAFTLALRPADYRFVAMDRSGHFAVQFFDRADTFTAARVVVIRDAQTPPPIEFVLTGAGRARAARH